MTAKRIRLICLFALQCIALATVTEDENIRDLNGGTYSPKSAWLLVDQRRRALPDIDIDKHFNAVENHIWEDIKSYYTTQDHIGSRIGNELNAWDNAEDTSMENSEDQLYEDSENSETSRNYVNQLEKSSASVDYLDNYEGREMTPHKFSQPIEYHPYFEGAEDPVSYYNGFERLGSAESQMNTNEKFNNRKEQAKKRFRPLTKLMEENRRNNYEDNTEREEVDKRRQSNDHVMKLFAKNRREPIKEAKTKNQSEGVKLATWESVASEGPFKTIEYFTSHFRSPFEELLGSRTHEEEREQLTDKEKVSKPDNQDTENENTEAYLEQKEDKVIETAVSLHADSKSNRAQENVSDRFWPQSSTILKNALQTGWKSHDFETKSPTAQRQLQQISPFRLAGVGGRDGDVNASAVALLSFLLLLNMMQDVIERITGGRRRRR